MVFLDNLGLLDCYIVQLQFNNVTMQQFQIIIESAKPDDIDRIVEIENRAYPFPWSRPLLLAEINGKHFSYVYVARLVRPTSEDHSIIGYHYFWLVLDEVHILNIAVEPEYQRTGCGSQLLQFGLDFGLKRGACSAFLEVRASNLAAQQFYADFGFHQVGIRKQYYSDNKEDAYVMRKWLDREAE
jgi:ribosomal-protein-alanine N-acetyltransferase